MATKNDSESHGHLLVSYVRITEECMNGDIYQIFSYHLSGNLPKTNRQQLRWSQNEVLDGNAQPPPFVSFTVHIEIDGIEQ